LDVDEQSNSHQLSAEVSQHPLRPLHAILHNCYMTEV
jgi:hypothetical protein